MADPTELNETGGRYEAPTLSEEFLNALVAELDNDDIVGIILGGSFARGEARPYSDVDIACFVRDAVKLPQKRFFYRDGRLGRCASRCCARDSNAAPVSRNREAAMVNSRTATTGGNRTNGEGD